MSKIRERKQNVLKLMDECKKLSEKVRGYGYRTKSSWYRYTTMRRVLRVLAWFVSLALVLLVFFCAAEGVGVDGVPAVIFVIVATVLCRRCLVSCMEPSGVRILPLRDKKAIPILEEEIRKLNKRCQRAENHYNENAVWRDKMEKASVIVIDILKSEYSLGWDDGKLYAYVKMWDEENDTRVDVNEGGFRDLAWIIICARQRKAEEDKRERLIDSFEKEVDKKPRC